MTIFYDLMAAAIRQSMILNGWIVSKIMHRFQKIQEDIGENKYKKNPSKGTWDVGMKGT